MKIIHIDLFSGIGGGGIAVDEVFGKENVTHIFCDNEPFAQAILKKHWPEATIYGDIRKFSKEQLIADARGKEPQWLSEQPWEESLEARSYIILTGGFPCQPFSQAGRRKGAQDDRFLWPEMLRVIREFKPDWIVGENVGGLLSMVQYESGFDVEQEEYSSEADARIALDQNIREGRGRRSGTGILEIIMGNLESIGYEVQPFVIPAVAVNAPHRRDRVWIVANDRHWNGSRATESRKYEESHRSGNATQLERPDERNKSGADTESDVERRNDGVNHREERYFSHDQGIAEKDKSERQGRERGIGAISADASHAIGERTRSKSTTSSNQGWSASKNRGEGLRRSDGKTRSSGIDSTGSNDANTDRTGWTGSNSKDEGRLGQPDRYGSNERRAWDKNWLEVATELCIVDDGLPNGLARPRGWRNAALHGAGNAWVPQVAIEILKGIKEIEKI